MNVAMTFKIHLGNGHSFQVTFLHYTPGEQIEIAMKSAHLHEPVLIESRGGVWDGDTFHPWHCIKRIEWLGNKVST